MLHMIEMSLKSALQQKGINVKLENQIKRLQNK